MPKTYPRISLSPEETAFLSQWMYDEVHFREGRGPAKQLQLEHNVKPAVLSMLIAAAFPDSADQEAACAGPPPDKPPKWPWTEGSLATRLATARAILAARTPSETPSNGEQATDRVRQTT